MDRYKTLSIPPRLAEDIKKLAEETGYWISMGSFVREAAIEKLHRERERLKALKEEGENG